MSFSCRVVRLSVFTLLCVLSGVCSAQSQPQFLNAPLVEGTGGRVTGFAAGVLQGLSSATDFVYVDAPVVTGGHSSITVGELLNQSGAGFADVGPNQITFPDVTNVAVALGDFDGDGNLDYAFALTTTVGTAPNLCIYYGTGLKITAGSSFDGGNSYPPAGRSFCTKVGTRGTQLPVFSYITNFPFKTTAGSPPGLILDDSLNEYFYILQASPGSVSVTTSSPNQLSTGAGPIYVGDLNGDGNNDFVINGQRGHVAYVYTGGGNGLTTGLSSPLVFQDFVHSMLLHDMDSDGKLDIVVENAKGAIEIYKGNGDSTFASASMGGTTPGLDGLSGDGGHLAAINPNTLDLLTTTPIGLSVLTNKGGLSYSLKGIYNIGSGRSSYALGDFFNTGSLDFAVDSAEGIAIVLPDGTGGFQSANAYAALQPALGATVGQFRTIGNPNRVRDVAVATGTAQAQILSGNGDGTFNTFSSPTNTLPSPNPTLWSNIVSGDFNGDGKLDIAYSLRGLPLPSTGSGLYVQYGNGDDTFQAPVAVSTSPAAPSGNIFFGESAVGDFNGDGIADIASIDGGYDDTLLGRFFAPPFSLGLNQSDNKITSFSQVAAGYFKTGRSGKEDLVFQEAGNFISYVNSGDGKNFTPKPAVVGDAPPLYPSTVLLTDVDGDGNGDLVVVYNNINYNTLTLGGGFFVPKGVNIWWGNGDGTFLLQPTVLSLNRNYYLGAVADMNGDGQPDLVLSDGSLVSILYNHGGRSFGAPLANGLLTGEQHFLAGQGINSISIADVTGDGIPDLVVANGGVTISNPIALGGPTASSLALTPNPDVNTGGITVLINSITAKPVTGTLVAAPEPSTFQATFTLTATLTPTAGVAMPVGTAQFYIDGFAVGSPVNVVPGGTTSTASYVVAAGNTYAGGTHSISVTYNGDGLNAPLSLNGSHLIQGGTTSVALALCVTGPTCPATGFIFPPYVANLTMYYGQGWNGSAQVTASDGGAIPGNLQFSVLYNGVTTLLCTLQAQVGGACPANVGAPGALGAQVGVNVLTAAYVPGTLDTLHTGSTSPAVTITVLQDSTTAAVVDSPNPQTAGQPVTFTATFTGNFASPTGTVQFSESFPPSNVGQLLGTATLTPGSGLSSTATFTTSSLPVGVDTISVSYAGTGSFAAASATTTETITVPLTGSFTLTVAPTPVSAGVGYATALTVTVTPKNGFVQDVKLACGTLPNEASCIFVSTTIAGGGGSTTLFVQTTAPHSCGSTQPYFLGKLGGPRAAPFALPALAGLVAMFIPGKRRWLRALVTLIVVGAATQMTGCGTCTDLGTRPATYTFQVTGTAAAGPAETEAQTVTLTVTI